MRTYYTKTKLYAGDVVNPRIAQLKSRLAQLQHKAVNWPGGFEDSVDVGDRFGADLIRKLREMIEFQKEDVEGWRIPQPQVLELASGVQEAVRDRAHGLQKQFADLATMVSRGKTPNPQFINNLGNSLKGIMFGLGMLEGIEKLKQIG